MNDKIIIFRRKGEASAPGKALTVLPPASVCVPQPERRERGVILRVAWRRNSESGRLECRWAPDRDTASEEGASRGRGAAERIAVAGASRRASIPSS